TGPASPQLREMRGRRGRLVLAKVSYDGFEPVDRLIILAGVDRKMIDPELARELFALPMEAAPSEGGSDIPDERFEDALDEAVFLDQEEVEGGERARFEAALARLERSVEDRMLILRRRLKEIEKRNQSALAERDRALSVDAREGAERTLRRI